MMMIYMYNTRSLFFLMTHHPPKLTLFPYTTLFRSPIAVSGTTTWTGGNIDGASTLTTNGEHNIKPHAQEKLIRRVMLAAGATVTGTGIVVMSNAGLFTDQTG